MGVALVVVAVFLVAVDVDVDVDVDVGAWMGCITCSVSQTFFVVVVGLI
jgi:hypothetical protein